MFAGEAQQEFHSILQCYRMLEQFRETGNLMLQAPDRNTPLHLCIALGLNQLAIRMIEAGAPSTPNPSSCMTALRNRETPPSPGPASRAFT